MSVVQRIKNLISFSSSSAGATSVATSPYIFTGLGVTNTLFATAVNIGNTTPTVTATTTASVTAITIVSSQIFLNGNVNTLNFVLNVTAATTSTICNFQLTLQNRTSNNTNASDIYGSLNGYNNSNVPLTGITVYADTSSKKATIKFISNGTTNQFIQGQLVYLSN